MSVTAAGGVRWYVSHTSGPLMLGVPSEAAAWIIAAGLVDALTYGQADSYAPGLLTQGMADIDRFLADPENEPSPGGKAALHRAFYGR